MGYTDIDMQGCAPNSSRLAVSAINWLRSSSPGKGESPHGPRDTPGPESVASRVEPLAMLWCRHANWSTGRNMHKAI